MGAHVGCEVLTGAAESNGCLGRVVSYRGARAKVRTDGSSGRVVGVKPQKLVVVVGGRAARPTQGPIRPLAQRGARAAGPKHPHLARARGERAADTMYPRSIVSFGLPRAGTTAAGAARVFRLTERERERERNAFACIERHQAFALAPASGSRTLSGRSSGWVGRRRTGARRKRGHVTSPLGAVTWRRCCGRGPTAACGMRGRVTPPRSSGRSGQGTVK